MSELIEAFLAGAVWSSAFLMLTMAIRSRRLDGLGPAVLAAYPTFFALQVLLPKGLGVVGLLTTPAIRSVYGVCLAVGIVFMYRARKSGATEQIGGEDDADTLHIRRLVLRTVGAVIAGLGVFTLVSPVHVWDVLAYHMPMVASYVQNGTLEPWPTQDLRQIYRVNAGELQMLNMALLAGSDAWVELPNLLGLVVLLTAAFEIARLATRRAALTYLVVILAITAPQIVMGATTAKNDLVFTAVLLSAFYWMIRGGLSSGRPVHMALAGLSAALAGTTKVMGLNVLGAVGLLGLVLLARGRLRLPQLLLFTGASLATLLLLAGDVYFFNLGRSAIPVGIAPGELHVSFGVINLIETVRFYLFDLTLGRLVRRPIFEHDFMHYGYLFPFILALGVAAGLRQFRSRRFVPAALALMGAALFLSIVAFRRPIGWDQRFMIWLVPTLSILALVFGERISSRRLVALTWVAVVLAAGNLGLALFLETDGLFRRSALHLATSGDLARYSDVPNRRYLWMREGFDALDRTATPRDSILYAGSDDSWMYPLWGRRFTRHVEGVWDADHTTSRIVSGDFRFLVVENATSPEIRLAAEKAAAQEGYRVLTAVDDRTIFLRSDTLSRAAAAKSVAGLRENSGGVLPAGVLGRESAVLVAEGSVATCSTAGT